MEHDRRAGRTRLDIKSDPVWTGECRKEHPVETEEGTRRPVQQNVGPGNEEGGGEWPDPATPPEQG